MTKILNNNILLLEKSQEFKEVIINQGIRSLVILSGVIQDKDLNSPPGSPDPDDFYIVGSSPTGAWSGHAKQIALPALSSTNTVVSGQWDFLLPFEGLRVFVLDESLNYQFNGTSWIPEVIALDKFTKSDTPDGTIGSTEAKLRVDTTNKAYIDIQGDELELAYAVLTGFSAGSATAISATDTIIQALQKVQGNFNRLGANRETLSGTKTLAATDKYHQVLNPNGANRDVILDTGWSGTIINNSNGTYALNIKESGGGATVQSLSSASAVQLVEVFYDGTEYVYLQRRGNY